MGTQVVGGIAAFLVLLVVAAVLARRRTSRPAPRRERDILTSADADADAPSADEVFYRAAECHLDAQVTGGNTLDGRIAGSFGIGTTVLPVTIGLLNFFGQTTLSAWTERLLVAALLAYGALIVCAVVSFAVRSLEYRPHPRTLRDLSGGGESNWDGAQLRRWVAEEYLLAVEKNETTVLVKSFCALGAGLALAAEAGFLAIAAYVTVT